VEDLVDLGLRFDLTVPLTRFYANNQGQLPSPFRAMQIGPVWRAERPQKGRYRQFTQCDIDTIGESSVLAEAELLEATLSALAAAGVRPVKVHVNDRRLLTAMAAACGVPEDGKPSYLVTLDKLDKVGWSGVRAELTDKGFGDDVGGQTERIVNLLGSAESPAELARRASDAIPGVAGRLDDVLEDLQSTAGALEALQSSREGPGEFSYALDPTIVRGLGYYTGQIFEVRHEAASGSVAGGGRYDGLVGRSLGRQVPACGISIGFERIVDLVLPEEPSRGTAVVYDRDAGQELVLSTARRVRSSGRCATLVPRRARLRAQLDDLARDGYVSFVLVASGEAGEEKSLSPGSRDEE
jgi:histidyl-tRNA synthetase